MAQLSNSLINCHCQAAQLKKSLARYLLQVALNKNSRLAPDDGWAAILTKRKRGKQPNASCSLFHGASALPPAVPNGKPPSGCACRRPAEMVSAGSHLWRLLQCCSCVNNLWQLLCFQFWDWNVQSVQDLSLRLNPPGWMFCILINYLWNIKPYYKLRPLFRCVCILENAKRLSGGLIYFVCF